MWRLQRHYKGLHLPNPPYIFLRPLTFGYDPALRNACLKSDCDDEACSRFSSPFSSISVEDGSAQEEWRSEERATGLVKYYG